MRSLCFVYISGVQSLNVTLYSFLNNFFVQTSFVIEFSTEVSCQCSEFTDSGGPGVFEWRMHSLSFATALSLLSRWSTSDCSFPQPVLGVRTSESDSGLHQMLVSLAVFVNSWVLLWTLNIATLKVHYLKLLMANAPPPGRHKCQQPLLWFVANWAVSTLLSDPMPGFQILPPFRPKSSTPRPFLL